jgi:uncharacterized protein with von Willebrand factor type A (vWA) domain
MAAPQPVVAGVAVYNAEYQHPYTIRRSPMVVSKPTHDSPDCATAVLLDNSGSVRFDDLFMNIRQIAFTLDDLVRNEYPDDWLSFIGFNTFAKLLKTAEVAALVPPPIVLYDPVVRLKADMNDERVVRSQIPQNFTNIQHGLDLARRMLAGQDVSNRQIILITDGLPTAHFEGQYLFLLYPPDARTIEATFREGELCRRERIAINIVLLQTWWQTTEDVEFALKLCESTNGRAYFAAIGKELDCSKICENFKRWREVPS